MANLCVPSFQCAAASVGQMEKRPGRRHPHCSEVAHGSMVSHDATTPRQRAHSAPQRETTASPSTFEETASTSQQSPSDGVQLIRQAVQAQGVSGKAQEIIMASWRPSTRTQYSTYLRKWNKFCARKHYDPFTASVNEVIEFLTELFCAGLSYSAINTARSALSTVVNTKSDKTVGAHSRVVRFMKGVFELRTPMPRYSATWDVSVVLNYLRSLGDNAKLSLKQLSLKLCTLLLLCSAQRVQTIHLLKTSCVHFEEDLCTIVIDEKLKQTRPGYHQKELVFVKYKDDETLCVVSCLKEYLNKTESLREKNGGKLVLCFQRPHKPASKDTIARWLKMVLSEAGIEGFAPHSVRGAASSAMLKSGVPVDDILKIAGWSNAQTFKKFYNRPVKNEKVNSSNTLLKYYAVQKPD